MPELQDLDGGVNVPAQDLNGPQVAQSLDYQAKYAAERDKRLKAEGVNQYIDLRRSDRYSNFIRDPWIDPRTPINTPVPDGGHCKVLIVGAGFGGILLAVRLLQAGFSLEDILIVDPAGGFGGTWYWNRYPGLMYDVESFIYLPLLEEMGYTPKRRYASGCEIREYAESVCEKYKLHERGMFQSSVKSLTWSDSRNEWIAKIVKKPKDGDESEHIVNANFVTLASGVLSNAKLPDVGGIDRFQGHMFHTARWDYQYTGGTPEKPELTGLEGKKVALVGTGATAVQAVPEVAKYAGQLHVFQRTPSSVDVRENRDIDPAWFEKNVATKKGWQRERNLNFTAHVENWNPKPAQNLVNDSWTNMASYSALIGTPKEVTMENLAEHIGEVHALDLPRQRRLHRRIDELVQNPEAANALKPWYNGWCKRPCFHDEYLPAFNSPNVTLVDTAGKGLDRITEKGIEIAGQEYEFDVIIWGTGFRSPALGTAASKAEITVTGKDGLEIEKVNDAGELYTLHGVTGRGFPNLYWTGPFQAGAAANNSFLLDILATHVSYIIAEATRMGGGNQPAVEPTLEAQESWAIQIASGAFTFAAISGCTPSYLNKEGEVDRLPPEENMKRARLGVWGFGFENFLDLLERWRADGIMEGLEVRFAGTDST